MATVDQERALKVWTNSLTRRAQTLSHEARQNIVDSIAKIAIDEDLAPLILRNESADHPLVQAIHRMS